MGGGTPLGIGPAHSPPFPDQLLPHHVLPNCPGIRQRVGLPLFAATARHRRLRHPSPRPLVFSPWECDGVPRHRAAASIAVQAYKAAGLHNALNNEASLDSFDSDGRAQSHFFRAGFFGKMTFLWMNPLVEKGYKRPLEEKDVPLLGVEDEAGTQYSMFIERTNAGKSSLFWAIVSCYKREIVVSGFFALLKILTLSAGPLLLKEFINVSSGKEAFRNEGVLIALGFLVSKSLESISQRQWYFRTRRVGIQVRSLLSAAIYQKQQKLPCFANVKHSSGEIMNYLMVDATRVGEFPFWFHRTWTTGLQLGIALTVLYNTVGSATIASVFVIVLTVLVNGPLVKYQQNCHNKLTKAQDLRLKVMSESLVNMKILKLYAWELHFKGVIERLRELELKWLSAFQLGKAYTSVFFWASPALVSAATFIACYFLGVSLDPSNVFTFVAAQRLVQDPINHIPNVIGSVIQARAAFSRISEFLGAPELPKDQIWMEYCAPDQYPIVIKSGCFSWDSSENSNLSSINLVVKEGTKVAICGEVGSGKSTLLAAILGEVPRTEGMEYVMGALSDKTVLLVTHQVEFLHAFDSVVLMSHGQIMHAASYQELLVASKEFQDLVNAHKGTADYPNVSTIAYKESMRQIIRETGVIHDRGKDGFDQLIRKEEREIGDIGLKPYLVYLGQNKGYIYATLVAVTNTFFTCGQVSQNSWLAANVQNPNVSTLNLVLVYIAIGSCSIIFLLFRALLTVDLNIESSRSLFSQLLSALFYAPMSFYHATPLGRILSRVSSDLGIIDLDVPLTLSFSISATLNACINLGVLCFFTWQVLFVAAPVIFMSVRLQRYYLASSKELMRINGTTKSLVANHLGESISGAVTIRAFKQENHFFTKMLELIDNNASPSFHCFAATEWLTQRLEIMSATILSSSAFIFTLLPLGTFNSGVVGMVLSYGLSLNMLFLFSIQNQCSLANQIISVERLNQYMHIASEALGMVEDNQLPANWPSVGKIELHDLEIQYNQESSPVLHGITCTIEGGEKIGIVGRTGSGKTTLINAIFRLVEPSGGTIIIDGQDITAVGLHDLRSRICLIPQDPVLFHGSIRYNLDPQGYFSDEQILEVLDKCQLVEVVREKQGLDSPVVEGGSNWSTGQRQLLCLGRALLRKSRILILDEATSSIDNATDVIIQKIIRTEFKDSTVITIAHRIPTVMDCSKILVINDGKMVEYDRPQKLLETEGSLFKGLLNEYSLLLSKAGL
ncbi:unnamed protein product [Urochloa decumbens]|uniref:ABC transporter C family member 10 n=1 Tax=Urochloa decumbens TaxID=240449 RepID=A0ABC9BLY1_9POAL